jgi:lipopolysaccharide transport system ATP-binding protein
VATSDTVLRVDHVSKRFVRGERHDSLRDLVPAVVSKLTGRSPERDSGNEFWALRDVSFALSRGDAYGIIGSNGAGKSTILKLITGIMAPTAGKIDVNGRLSALIEVGAGFHPDLTGRENIFLNGAILGMKRSEIERKFDAIVAFSGLEDFIDTPVKRYSTGMYARLGFSVAAHVDPDILIVDEVLSVGDVVFQNRCLERMHSVLRSGATVLFVSHNLRAIAELCQKSILLEHGKVVAHGASQDVLTTYLERSGQQGLQPGERDVSISAVRLRRERAEGVAFESGEKVWIDIEAEAARECEPFSIVLFLNDDKQYEVFHTSTEYLGCPPISLKPGGRFLATFELDLPLGGGTYYLGALLYRFTNEKTLHRVFPAVTLFVSTVTEARGAVNLHPRITAFGPASAPELPEEALQK